MAADQMLQFLVHLVEFDPQFARQLDKDSCGLLGGVFSAGHVEKAWHRALKSLSPSRFGKGRCGSVAPNRHLPRPLFLLVELTTPRPGFQQGEGAQHTLDIGVRSHWLNRRERAWF